MNDLYLLRHGPTAASLAGAPLGQADWPVTDEGEAKWPALKNYLASLPLDLVVTSDLRRATKHAVDLRAEAIIDPRLREQNFGRFEGRPWEKIEEAEQFFLDPLNNAPPDGESFAQCSERTIAALQPLLHRRCNLLLLGHAGPLRAILAFLLDLPLRRALDLQWAPFGLSHLRCYAEDKATLVFHNRLQIG